MSKPELTAAASIGLLYIVRMLGLFMILPVLPLASEIAFATPFLIGLALGIYGLSQACLQIPMGLLSDRIGRKPVICLGLVVFILGSVIAGLSDSIYVIIVGRFIQGCGAIASTLLALVSDVTRVESRSKAMAIVGICIGGSFGIALILGPYIASLGGLSAVFFFNAAAGVVGLVVLWLFVPSPTVKSHNPEASVSTGLIRLVLANGDLRRTSVGVFMLHYLLMSSFVVLPLMLSATGRIANEDLHFAYFFLLLVSFLLMTPLMWLSDRAAFVRPLLLAMIATFLIALVVLGSATAFTTLIFALLLFFMAFNLLEVILPALVSKLSPAGHRGTGMGVYSTAQFAGAFAGGAMGGAIVSAWDISHLLYVNAVLCALWLGYSYGLAPLRNYKTITCRVRPFRPLSASAVADALLSIDGVLDVALVEKEGIAYLKVDKDNYDDDALIRASGLEVVRV